MPSTIDFDLELQVSVDYEVIEAEPEVGIMSRSATITEVWATHGSNPVHKFNIIDAIHPAIIESWEQEIEEGLRG